MVYYFIIFFWCCNRNPKLKISTAPSKAKSQELVYSQALNQNTIDRQGLRPDSQSGRHLDGYGGLCLDERRRGRCAEENKSGYPSGSRRNQFIHRHLTRTQSIGRG